MAYVVRYRKIGSWIWRRLRRVKGDGFVHVVERVPPDRLQASQFDIRYFIRTDESRVEIPAQLHEFRFSRERFISIKKNMEKTAGQAIPVNEGEDE